MSTEKEIPLNVELIDKFSWDHEMDDQGDHERNSWEPQGDLLGDLGVKARF